MATHNLATPWHKNLNADFHALIRHIKTTLVLRSRNKIDFYNLISENIHRLRLQKSSKSLL